MANYPILGYSPLKDQDLPLTSEVGLNSYSLHAQTQYKYIYMSMVGLISCPPTPYVNCISVGKTVTVNCFK